MVVDDEHRMASDDNRPGSETDRPRVLESEVAQEVGPHHVLHGGEWIVVAEALPGKKCSCTTATLRSLFT
jgi:hypothetical protein